MILRIFTPPLVIREAKKQKPSLPNSSLTLPTNISKKSVKGNDEQIVSLDQMIVSPLTRKKLFHIAQLLVARETTLQEYKSSIYLEKSIRNKSSSTSQRLLLPNILIFGPPGTGKSFAATSLARHSGLPYLSLCAGDILAVSPTLSSPSATNSTPSSSSSLSQSGGPGGLLRDVLESAAKANSQRGFLVILDDADALIATRKRTFKPENENDSSVISPSNESEGTREESSIDCVHILLHRLRVNTSSLGTLITTSMELDQIDPALLDR